MNEIWALLIEDEDGNEGIAVIETPNYRQPMVTIKEAFVKTLRDAAPRMAWKYQQPVRLVKLMGGMSVMETFPVTPPPPEAGPYAGPIDA